MQQRSRLGAAHLAVEHDFEFAIGYLDDLVFLRVDMRRDPTPGGVTHSKV